jgi:DNA mismatch repair ATPase MutS
MSIARAIVEYTNSRKIGAKTLFATHYHELTSMEEEFEGVVNYNIAAKKRGDSITFLRKIVRGSTDDSYGIEVAKLAGLPNEVIKRAKEVLASVEETSRAIAEATEGGIGTKKKAAPKELTDIKLFDIFTSKELGKGRSSRAYSLTFRAEDRTLTDDEVNAAFLKIVESLKANLAVEIREG